MQVEIEPQPLIHMGTVAELEKKCLGRAHCSSKKKKLLVTNEKIYKNHVMI